MSDEYIRRVEAEEAIEEYCCRMCADYNQYEGGCVSHAQHCQHLSGEEILKPVKSADVQPVKRGRWLGHHAIWIDQPKIEGWFVQAKCSECEKWAHVMNPYTKFVDYECCPHCGARMDLKEGE